MAPPSALLLLTRAAQTKSQSHKKKQTSKGLTTAAKTGIAIGCVLAVCIIAVIVFLCVRRRKRLARVKRQQEQQEQDISYRSEPIQQSGTVRPPPGIESGIVRTYGTELPPEKKQHFHQQLPAGGYGYGTGLGIQKDYTSSTATTAIPSPATLTAGNGMSPLGSERKQGTLAVEIDGRQRPAVNGAIELDGRAI